MDLVAASSYALGENRDYAAPDGAKPGTVYFQPCNGGWADQADYLFSNILPGAMKRSPGLPNSEIAVLYPTARIGDYVAAAAEQHGFPIIRTDGNALYPRSSLLMRWIEACASWCCGGWRTGHPRFARILRGARSLFREVLTSDESRRAYQRILTEFLWRNRDERMVMLSWLQPMRAECIGPFAKGCRTLAEDMENLINFIARLDRGGDKIGMTLAEFSGQSAAANRINLSTLHSAKGREFEVVVLFAMEQGRIPWNNVGQAQLRESRRLFYVVRRQRL